MDLEEKIIIYRSPKGEIEIQTKFKEDSIWLSQKDMANLFETDRTVITRHLGNIFSSKELDIDGNVQKMHIASSDRPVNYYSLDAIISVGYRVNSKKATDFRIWSSRVLKKYLTTGYALNEEKLKINSKNLLEAKKILQFISTKAQAPAFTGHEREFLKIISELAKSWGIEEKSDKKTKPSSYKLNFYLFQDLISNLKKELLDLQSIEIDLESSQNLEKIIDLINKNHKNKSLEEQAANLFYETIKKKPLPDGNKRIASFLFLYLLQKNNNLFRPDGSIKVSDKTIIALAVLISQSDAEDRTSIIKLITSLISD